MNKLLELSTRVLCDSRPETPVDGVYLYCQTRGSQRSVFQAALFLHHRSFSSKILILQSIAKSGYPSLDEWCEQLQEAGFSHRQIQGVSVGETASLNTLIESEALIKFARQNKYNSIFVVAPPFQQLRAFMTAVRVAL